MRIAEDSGNVYPLYNYTSASVALRSEIVLPVEGNLTYRLDVPPSHPGTFFDVHFQSHDSWTHGTTSISILSDGDNLCCGPVSAGSPGGVPSSLYCFYQCSSGYLNTSHEYVTAISNDTRCMLFFSDGFLWFNSCSGCYGGSNTEPEDQMLFVDGGTLSLSFTTSNAPSWAGALDYQGAVTSSISRLGYVHSNQPFLTNRPSCPSTSPYRTLPHYLHPDWLYCDPRPTVPMSDPNDMNVNGIPSYFDIHFDGTESSKALYESIFVPDDEGPAWSHSQTINVPNNVYVGESDGWLHLRAKREVPNFYYDSTSYLFTGTSVSSLPNGRPFPREGNFTIEAKIPSYYPHTSSGSFFEMHVMNYGSWNGAYSWRVRPFNENDRIFRASLPNADTNFVCDLDASWSESILEFDVKDVGAPWGMVADLESDFHSYVLQLVDDIGENCIGAYIDGLKLVDSCGLSPACPTSFEFVDPFRARELGITEGGAKLQMYYTFADYDEAGYGQVLVTDTIETVIRRLGYFREDEAYVTNNCPSSASTISHPFLSGVVICVPAGVSFDSSSLPEPVVVEAPPTPSPGLPAYFDINFEMDFAENLMDAIFERTSDSERSRPDTASDACVPANVIVTEVPRALNLVINNDHPFPHASFSCAEIVTKNPLPVSGDVSVLGTMVEKVAGVRFSISFTDFDEESNVGEIATAVYPGSTWGIPGWAYAPFETGDYAGDLSCYAPDYLLDMYEIDFFHDYGMSIDGVSGCMGFSIDGVSWMDSCKPCYSYPRFMPSKNQLQFVDGVGKLKIRFSSSKGSYNWHAGNFVYFGSENAPAISTRIGRLGYLRSDAAYVTNEGNCPFPAPPEAIHGNAHPSIDGAIICLPPDAPPFNWNLLLVEVSPGSSDEGLIIGMASFGSVLFVAIVLFFIAVIVLLLLYYRRRQGSKEESSDLDTELKDGVTVDDVDELVRREQEEAVANLEIDRTLFEVNYKELTIKNSIGRGGSSAVVFRAVYQGFDVAFSLLYDVIF